MTKYQANYREPFVNVKCHDETRDKIRLRITEIQKANDLFSIGLQFREEDLDGSEVSLSFVEDKLEVYERISTLAICISNHYDLFSTLIVQNASKCPTYVSAMKRLGYQPEGYLWFLKSKPDEEIVIDFIFQFCLYSYLLQSKRIDKLNSPDANETDDSIVLLKENFDVLEKCARCFFCDSEMNGQICTVCGEDPRNVIQLERSNENDSIMTSFELLPSSIVPLSIEEGKDTSKLEKLNVIESNRSSILSMDEFTECEKYINQQTDTEILNSLRKTDYLEDLKNPYNVDHDTNCILNERKNEFEKKENYEKDEQGDEENVEEEGMEEIEEKDKEELGEEYIAQHEDEDEVVFVKAEDGEEKEEEKELEENNGESEEVVTEEVDEKKLENENEEDVEEEEMEEHDEESEEDVTEEVDEIKSENENEEDVEEEELEENLENEISEEEIEEHDEDGEDVINNEETEMKEEENEKKLEKEKEEDVEEEEMEEHDKESEEEITEEEDEIKSEKENEEDVEEEIEELYNVKDEGVEEVDVEEHDEERDEVVTEKEYEKKSENEIVEEEREEHDQDGEEVITDQESEKKEEGDEADENEIEEEEDSEKVEKEIEEDPHELKANETKILKPVKKRYNQIYGNTNDFSVPSWICEFCTFRNDDEAVNCIICLNIRKAHGCWIEDFETEKEELQEQVLDRTLQIKKVKDDFSENPIEEIKTKSINNSSSVKDGDNVTNDGGEPDERWLCRKCKTLNDLDVSKCSQCSSIADFVDKWICDQCKFYNNKLALTCKACQTKNRHLMKCTKCQINRINNQRGDKLCTICKGRNKTDNYDNDVVRSIQLAIKEKSERRDHPSLFQTYTDWSKGNLEPPLSSYPLYLSRPKPKLIKSKLSNRQVKDKTELLLGNDSPGDVFKEEIQRKCQQCQKPLEKHEVSCCQKCVELQENSLYQCKYCQSFTSFRNKYCISCNRPRKT